MHRFALLMIVAILAVGELLASASLADDGREAPSSEKQEAARFVGSQSCASCHVKEHTEWRGSHHHAAMQEAKDDTVLGDFSGAIFAKGGVETSFFKRDNKFWVRTDGSDGKVADFEVRYTFGFSPLQQYLIAMPRGRYQALGIAWDSRPKEVGGQRWYHLYPDQPLKAGSPLHWTGIDQNWNYQCAWCHSTNLQKNYDVQSRTFQTTWSEINVGCEACHGPASHHMAWANKADGGEQYKGRGKGFTLTLDERRGVTWQMGAEGQAMRSRPSTSNTEVEVCASCHSRRQQFSSDVEGLKRSFFEAFRPSLLENGLYHSDGQQRDEVYKYGSFLQSKMYAAGVTCSDCHDPHSGRLRGDGNAVCSQCHAPEKFDTATHHHHKAGSNGARCANCHMPATTYMGVDARHDHSFRIPRPDQSIVLGTPNACTTCHSDKSATWARDAIKGWVSTPKHGAQDFAEAFDLGNHNAPGAQQALVKVATRPSQSDIARASALSRLRNFPSLRTLEVAVQSLNADDPLVRVAAVSIVAGADVATRRSQLVPRLRDISRLVRMEAARALAGGAGSGLLGEERAAFDKALGEYVAAQLFNAERPESHMNLGNLYLDQGRLDAARQSFRTAIELDKSFVAASIALAELERAQGDEAAASNILNNALADNQKSGPVEHALGLSFIRQKRIEEAIDYLTRAVADAPENARFAYVLAVALHDTGNPRKATEALRTALLRNPYDRELLSTLVSYEMEAGNLTAALDVAELLARLEPDSQDIARLLSHLRNRMR